VRILGGETDPRKRTDVGRKVPVRDQTVGLWLEALASSAPSPGGGAAAALNAAIGAALIEMACQLTIGRPRYVQHEAEMLAALSEATKLRDRALQLAADDVKAFGAVGEAYKLPRETDEQKQARTEQIRRALQGATEVPLDTAVLAGNLIKLAGRIVGGANVSVLADVAAAAVSARAALEVALINVEANLAALGDASRGQHLSERLTAVSSLAAEADQTLRGIRSRIGP
jgi:formiminotetrahydrofolate cyclodeaminase